jgi:CTP:phosphocholine cytidylyltransferase-like protein
MIVDDNGNLVIYGNAFYDVTFDGFKGMINKERGIISDIIQKGTGDSKDLLNVDNLNMYIDKNNEDKLNKYGKLDEINRGGDDRYIYRAS